MKTEYISLKSAKLLKKLKYRGAKLFYEEKIPGSEFEYWDDGQMLYLTDYKYEKFPKITYFDAFRWLFNKKIFIEFTVVYDNDKPYFEYKIHTISNQSIIEGEISYTKIDKMSILFRFNLLNMLIFYNFTFECYF